jgi:signal transduction histidine kinase
MPLDDAMREQFLANILGSAQHLLKLINDLLDLSKAEAGKKELRPEPFSLEEALRSLQTLIQPLANKKHQELLLQLDPGLGEIEHDLDCFRQVLLNLLSNAVKFTPENGRITISTLMMSDWIEVAVSDTGIGIKPEEHALVFEEFTQIDSGYTRKQQGTGLGLTLARRFARMMGGDIRLESVPGQGSTFTICLPRCQPKPPVPS